MIRELNKEEYKNIVGLGLLITSNFSTDKISDDEKIIVFESNNNIVAFLQYLVNYETIDIINIAVLPEYRREKIATKLINYISSNNNINQILLEVRESNEVAIKFYENLGFKQLRIIKNYYYNENALSMEKVIK